MDCGGQCEICTRCIVTDKLRKPTSACNTMYNKNTREVTSPQKKPQGYDADHIIALQDIVCVYCSTLVKKPSTESLPDWLLEVRDIANGSGNLCWIPKEMNATKETSAAKDENVQDYLIAVDEKWYGIIRDIARVNNSFAKKLLDHFLSKHGLKIDAATKKSLTAIPKMTDL